MKNLQIYMTFRQCHIHNSDEFLTLARVVAGAGFVITKSLTNPMPVSDEDLPALIDQKRIVQEGSGRKLIDWMVMLSGTPNVRQPCDSTITFQQFPAGTNQLTLGGLLEYELQTDGEIVNEYAQEILRLSLLMYPSSTPELGWVDEVNANYASANDSRRLKVTSISWANFFGPAARAKYGDAFIQGLPGYRLEKLPNGGFFHQLTENFVAYDSSSGTKIREHVVAYCVSKGLKVTCRVPYRL